MMKEVDATERERFDAGTRGRGDAETERADESMSREEVASSQEEVASVRRREATQSETTQAEVTQAEVALVAVSVKHVSKTYPVPLARLKRLFRRKASTPVEALRDVSFDVRAGEVFGLIGRNGAGKTTLTKIIATLVQPTSGAVTVRGFDSVREEEQVRAQIGLASAEERSFYWRLTAEQNLLFFARLYGLRTGAARRRIAELLSLIELEEVARRRFGELSTGNKQRMAVARALLNSPPVLLLDEPTRSLDPVAAARTRSLISSLASGQTATTVLLTSHNLAEVEELCGRVAIISRGQIRALDTPANLRARHRQQEKIIITLQGVSAEHSAELLRDALGEVDTTTEERDGKTYAAFTREPSDELLNRTLRALQEGGARILSCEVERGSLLDVLEAFESAPEESLKEDEARREADALASGEAER